MTPRRAGTILLASSSPRRHEILAAAGYRFRGVQVDDVVEAKSGVPTRLATGNARLKCRAARGDVGPFDVVLGADTVVCVDGLVLGKPASRREASAMLQRLSGRWHRVVTGIFLRTAAGAEFAAATSTRVHVRRLAAEWIRAYLSTGEGDDKAGAYGIQGAMAAQVDKISGCYFNVMGLSPATVWSGLEALGFLGSDFLSPLGKA